MTGATTSEESVPSLAQALLDSLVAARAERQTVADRSEPSVPQFEVANDDPTDFEYCPNDAQHWHCEHWYDCEPCCRCGDNTPDPICDCDRCTEARTTCTVLTGEGRP